MLGSWVRAPAGSRKRRTMFSSFLFFNGLSHDSKSQMIPLSQTVAQRYSVIPRGSRDKANSLMKKRLKDHFIRIRTSAYRPAATFDALIGIPPFSFFSPAIRTLRLRQNRSPKDGLRQPQRNLIVTALRHPTTTGYELECISLYFKLLHLISN